MLVSLCIHRRPGCDAHADVGDTMRRLSSPPLRRAHREVQQGAQHAQKEHASVGQSRGRAAGRRPNLHLAEPGEDFALGKVTVANHTLPSVGQLLLNERRQVLLELRGDRRFDQPPRPGPKKLREGIRNTCWRRQRNHRIVAYVRRAPLAETVIPNSISAKTRCTTQLIRTPISTIARKQREWGNYCGW